MTAVDSSLADALRHRYELERELGHGGMATVYLAKDVKHHRRVAVKVLRPELAATLGVNRFLSEIKVAAGLQHPHILPLLDSGETDGFLYYVMPYVEGPSLRERLDREGELPISVAVRILAEVADALDYAHRQGVVHRDMKPDNVMLSGRHSLVMDFGIAKAVSEGGESRRATTEGVALGTPVYMAPEQGMADPHLDHRVDIYAFGVMGYELLTGSPPFFGRSAQEIIAAHVTRPAEPISHRRPSVSPALATLIMHCLEKRPADRPQSAGELVHAFEAMITPTHGLTRTATRPVSSLGRSFPQRGVIVGGALAAAAVGALLWRHYHSEPETVIVPRLAQVTFLGNVKRQEISPDGQLLAYVERGDTLRLFVKDMKGGSVIPITTLGAFHEIRWSPDGASLLHLGLEGQWHGELFPRLGGPARPLPRSSVGSVGDHGAFSPDGSQLATWPGRRQTVRFTTLATGVMRTLRLPDTVSFYHEGDWSPNGRFLALLSQAKSGIRFMLRTVDLRSGTLHELVSDTLPLSPPRWSPTSDAIYFLNYQSELRKIRVTTTGNPQGAPEVLQTGLGAAEPGSPASNFSITADGRKLAFVKEKRYSNLWLATRSRERSQFTTTQLTQGTGEKVGKRISPDGRQIAFVQAEGGFGRIVVLPVRGGVSRRLTTSLDAVGHPAWSPDGRHVAFIASTKGVYKVRTVSIEGGEERTYERTEVGQGAYLTWSPNDRILYKSPGNRNFRWLDPTTEAEEPLVPNGDSIGWMWSATPSPDKRFVAVGWNRAPHPGVYVISLRDGSQKLLGPPQISNSPLGWSADGAFLYVEDESDGRIRRIPVRGGSGVIVASNPFKDADCGLTEGSAGVSLLCTVEEAVADTWVLENFDPTVPAQSR